MDPYQIPGDPILVNATDAASFLGVSPRWLANNIAPSELRPCNYEYNLRDADLFWDLSVLKSILRILKIFERLTDAELISEVLRTNVHEILPIPYTEATSKWWKHFFKQLRTAKKIKCGRNRGKPQEKGLMNLYFR